MRGIWSFKNGGILSMRKLHGMVLLMIGPHLFLFIAFHQSFWLSLAQRGLSKLCYLLIVNRYALLLYRRASESTIFLSCCPGSNRVNTRSSMLQMGLIEIFILLIIRITANFSGSVFRFRSHVVILLLFALFFGSCLAIMVNPIFTSYSSRQSDMSIIPARWMHGMLGK